MVAELEPPHARHRRAQLDPAPWWWRCGSPIAAVVAAPLDLDVLAALVAIALVAAVVAELAPLDLDVLAALVAIALVAAVVTELAVELVAAPLDLDGWRRCWSPIAAVVAAPHTRHRRPSSTRRPGGGDAVVAELAAELVAAPLDLDVRAALSGSGGVPAPRRWSPSRWWPHRSTSTCSPRWSPSR